MKLPKVILISIFAAAIGLLAGYLIFGSNHETKTISEQPAQNQVNKSEEEKIWTCSMHPQIRQNSFGDCPLCGMDLIPLEDGNSGNPLVLEMTEEAVKLASIQTTVVGDKNYSNNASIRLSGKVKVDERLAASQVIHIPGRIEKLYVSFTGEDVREGQKIAEIYSPELITAQKELIEAKKIESTSPNLTEAARQKLRYWKINEELIEEIESTGSIKELFTLYADKSGIVVNRRVTVGDYVKQGQSLLDLISLKKVWVLFDAYEEDLNKISIGDRIEFTTPSLANKTYKTTVEFIDPIINSETRVASIRASVNNSNLLLKPEMLTYGKLKSRSRQQSILSVPKSAVLWTGKRSVVYIQLTEEEIPSFEYREIEIGKDLGESYEVISGLEHGDVVVSYGSFTIDAAAQLNNQNSMMNKMVGIKRSELNNSIPDFNNETPQIFKDQLYQIVLEYLNLKNSLVDTDPISSKQISTKLKDKLDEIDMSLVEGESHTYLMNQLDALKNHNDKISGSNEIEEQRNQFEFLSKSLIESVKAFGIGDHDLYVQHCPMANRNKGADWLSSEKEIRNPYFGDKMLKCGTIKSTIGSSLSEDENAN